MMIPEITPLEICLAVFITSLLVYSAGLAVCWFYRQYLHNEGNWYWMAAEQVVCHLLPVFTLLGWLYEEIQTYGALFERNVGMAIQQGGLFCLSVMLSIVALAGSLILTLITPFVMAMACILSALTLLCSLPGLLYGLCWASHDAGEFIGLLSPSHQLKDTRVQAKRE